MTARTTERVPLVVDTPGTERHLLFHRWGAVGARPKAYLQASIHANELPGALVLQHLMPMLDAAAARGEILGEIVVAPVANPIGLSQVLHATHVGRFSFADRTNFNREHHDLAQPIAEAVRGRLTGDAAANEALIRRTALELLAAYQPIGQAMDMRTQLIRRSIDADYVFDLHCDQQAAMHLFVDGRHLPLARALGADLQAAAVMWSEPKGIARTFSGANGGLWARIEEILGTAQPLGHGCFSATVELRGQHDATDALAARDAEGLFRFLQRQGVLGGTPAPAPEALAEPTPIAGMDVGYAPKAGFLVFHRCEGARVAVGDPICDVVDPMAEPSEVRTTMRAESDGVMFVRRRDGSLCWPGMVSFRIAAKEPVPHRAGRPSLDD